MSAQKRNNLENIFETYASKAQEYRAMIARTNRNQPVKLFTERVAELALAKLGE